MEVNTGELRARLERLQWGDGLTPREIRNQASDLHERILRYLPQEYRFSGPGEVMSFVHHLLEHGVLPGNPDLAPVMPPPGYGDSPTGRTFASRQPDHGVGSGAGSGYTGSGAQTGDSRKGVDYTAEDPPQGTTP